MRNLYRVQIGYDIAVVAKDEIDAENKARWELRERNLEDEQAHVAVAPLSEDMPEGWDAGCRPYGDNPDGHSINWFRNETAPVQDVTFHVIGNPNVIAQARAALKGFDVVMTTWVKEEKSG
jgi:hypothetical protein